MTIFQFDKKYFIYGLLLFGVETVIALYARDQIIRPYGGDFLVVILLYCILRCFTHLSVNRSCIIVLLLSYVVDTSIIICRRTWIGMDQFLIFCWVTISPGLIICYTLGMGTVLVIEKIIQRINPENFPHYFRKHNAAPLWLSGCRVLLPWV